MSAGSHDLGDSDDIDDIVDDLTLVDWGGESSDGKEAGDDS